MRDTWGPLQPQQLCVCGHRADEHRYTFWSWPDRKCRHCGDRWCRYFPR